MRETKTDGLSPIRLRVIVVISLNIYPFGEIYKNRMGISTRAKTSHIIKTNN